MKNMKQITILYTILASLLAVQFASATPEENKAKLEKSEKLWAETKKNCGGNYSYQVIVSYMMGDRKVTTITVKNNVVVERKMEKYGVPNPEKEAGPELLYHEKGADVGKDKRGGKALTVDQMHAIAKTRLNEKLPESHKLYYRFDKSGLLKSCYSVDTRIMDDVSINGFTTSNFKAEVQPEK